MNKQEALDSLECFRSNTAHILGENDAKVKTIETCMMLVREAEETPSAQQEQKWISVKEKLPDIKEHYVSEPCIVYCDNGAYGFAVLEENIFGQVGWNCERDDEYHEPLGEVLAWMPLPKPYQEGEQNE